MEDNKVKIQLLFLSFFFYYYLIQLFIDKWKFLQQLISINCIKNETKSK